MSGSAKFRLVLLLSLAGLCGYVGYLIFRERDPMPPLIEGEKAYLQDGKSLEAQGDFAGAAAKYDQALVYLEHAYKRLNDERGAHGLDEDAAKEAMGKTLKLKAAAIRDKHFAKAAAEGKPLPEMTDSVTGEKFRSINTIPDAKDREEAAGSLRGAAIFFLPKDFQTQLDALRLALMTNPMQWDQIEKFSTAILNIKDDSRAKYLMAKFDFEQPIQGTSKLTPPEKRSTERVRNALRLIDDVKADRDFPIWRAEYLRAQIHYWFLKQYAGKKDREYNQELDLLERMLLDNTNGAIVRIYSKEGMDRLTPWDVDAILGLHSMAADVALETIRKRRLKENTALTDVFKYTRQFCESKLKSQDPAFPRSQVLGLLLNTMNTSQPILANHQPREWEAAIELIRPVLREEFNQNRCDPLRIAQFSELLMNEAQFRRNEPAKAAALRNEAKQWLDEGLKFGKEHKFSAAEMLPFNLLAANVCYISNEKREIATPFIAALQETRIPQAQATALVIDGAYDEREGRLERAKEKMEKALAIIDGNEDVRAHASLANIYMALGQPEHALINLAHLQHIYDRFSDLSDLEKQWMSQFIKSQQDLQALTAIANLDNARRIVAAQMRRNPNQKKIPYELVKDSEDRVKKLMEREPMRSSGAGFTVRTAWIYYLNETKRYDMAAAEIRDLSKDYSSRIELLMLMADAMVGTARESGDPVRIKAATREVDKLIERFIAANPQNQSAQLFYATWLAQTDRQDDAEKYLQGIIASSTLTDEVRRVASAILMQKNVSGSVMSIARHLPPDPEIDRILFELGRNTEKARTDLKTSLTRHESLGLSRILAAEDLYAAGDFEKAATAFADTLDFTRVKALAQQGLMRSILSLANKDPDAAYSAIQQISRLHPTEPVVLLSYAYVFLARDEIGTPTDNWEIRRNMASALNEWQTKMAKQGADSSSTIPLTRAEFWQRAGRMDHARAEARRAINADRKNPRAIAAYIAMVLDDPAQDVAGELRPLMAELKALAPDLPATPFLEARVEEFSKNFGRAAEIYEGILKNSPGDRNAMMQLVNVYDHLGKLDLAANLAREWRKQIPNDLRAISAEIRILVKQNKNDQARAAAAKFLEETNARLVANAAKAPELKNLDPKTQQERQAKYIQDGKGIAELEIASGFLAGGALNEAEIRLNQLPKSILQGPVAQALLGDIYLQQKRYDKAEEVYEALSRRDPRNLVVAQNLAYLLAVHRGQPAKAREVVLSAMKTGPQALSHRTGDRLPPTFLATVGTVYAKLNEPKYAKELQEIFQPAAERYRNDPRIQLYLGLSNEFNGDYRQARSKYETALKGSNHPGLTESQRYALVADAQAFLKRVENRDRQ
jgi:predicted Zn-dependent protease